MFLLYTDKSKNSDIIWLRKGERSEIRYGLKTQEYFTSTDIDALSAFLKVNPKKAIYMLDTSIETLKEGEKLSKELNLAFMHT